MMVKGVGGSFKQKMRPQELTRPGNKARRKG